MGDISVFARRLSDKYIQYGWSEPEICENVSTVRGLARWYLNCYSPSEKNKKQRKSSSLFRCFLL